MRAKNAEAPCEHRSHAKVFGRLVDHEIRIIMLPDASAAAWDVPIDLVPIESRRPNSLLWVTWEQSHSRVTKIEPREPDDLTPMY